MRTLEREAGRARPGSALPPFIDAPVLPSGPFSQAQALRARRPDVSLVAVFFGTARTPAPSPRLALATDQIEDLTGPLRRGLIAKWQDQSSTLP